MNDNVEYAIFLEDDGSCRLDIQFRGMSRPVSNGWDNTQNLLASFLNKKYIPQIFDYDAARSNQLLYPCPFSKDECRGILDSWDHESILEAVEDIYGEENEFVKKLNPSQRYFVWLAFKGGPTFIEYSKPGTAGLALINEPKIEMSCADRFRVTDVAKEHHVDFYNLYHKIMEEQNIGKERALYIAGCMITANYNVRSEIGAVFCFSSTESLVNWLLLSTIKSNKYVYRCKYCDRYFGAKRSDKMTCSTDCTIAYEKWFGRYDDPEITRLTKCINSSIDERIKGQDAGVKYVNENIPNFAEINFKAFKTAFQKKCRSRNKKLKEYRKMNDLDRFYDEVQEYLKWLAETDAYVKGFVRDRLV